MYFTQNQSMIVHELRTHLPVLDEIEDIAIVQLYEKCISLRQKQIRHNGMNLENIVKCILTENNIPFREQVEIDHDGIIVGFGKKSKKCFHVVDFVIGDVSRNVSICKYIVVSCKTTCRERWTQDNWTLTIKPKKYILMTTSCDYPNSRRFHENNDRKIITSVAKKRDDRCFKLCFDDLVEEIMS